MSKFFIILVLAVFAISNVTSPNANAGWGDLEYEMKQMEKAMRKVKKADNLQEVKQHLLTFKKHAEASQEYKMKNPKDQEIYEGGMNRIVNDVENLIMAIDDGDEAMAADILKSINKSKYKYHKQLNVDDD